MQQIHDIIIIGGGMTGLSAAVCAGAAELDVLVIDRSERPGGLLLNEEMINSYPALPKISGEELVSMIREHCELLGVRFVSADAESIETDDAIKSVWAGRKEFTATAVLIAAGSSVSGFAPDLSIERTGEGLIKAGSDCRTSCAFVYAAGNARCASVSGILEAASEGENSIKSFLEDIK